MTRIRFLLDENMAHGVRDQLLYHKPTLVVLCIGDDTAPALGTPDPVLLDWLEENNYILVSRNRKTMPGHLKEHLEMGKHVPGILLIRRGILIGQLVEDLLLIWEASELTDYQDRIEYLPL
jgi:hypothetical protein